MNYSSSRVVLSIASTILTVFLSGIPIVAPGEIISLDVSYAGTINNSQLLAHATGIIDTTGSTPGSVTVNFSSFPDDFHPAAIASSYVTFYCPNNYSELGGAQNLFTLAGGNYEAVRLIEWPEFNDSFLLANASMSLDAGVLSGTINLNGVYSGPTDLVDGDENYGLAWLPAGSDALIEAGTSTLTTTGGQRHPVNFVSQFSGLATPLASPQTTVVDFNWSFVGNEYLVTWSGVTRTVPEPASIFLALGCGSYCSCRLRRRPTRGQG